MNLKKTIFLTSIVYFFINGIAFSQNQTVLLQWKIAKGDTLKYQTVMKAESSTEESTNKTDSSNALSGVNLKKLFQSLNKANDKMKYQTNLFLNPKNNSLIDIEMRTVVSPPDTSNKKITNQDIDGKKDQKKSKKTKPTDEELDSSTMDDMFRGFSGMGNMVVLRGRITQNGEVVSNYYKNGQKNLVSTLFALPNKPVQIGEKWKLGTNFIEMDQNFYADSSSTTNEVYIEKIIEQDNDKIAVIKYNIQEYVIGDFIASIIEMPGMGTNKKTFMKYSHFATGYFSIGKGKWISYEGETEVDTNFSLIGGKTKTIFKLIQ